MQVNGNHPLAEVIAKKLFGITTVQKDEQERMINRACKAAVEWYENNRPTGEVMKKDKIIKVMQMVAEDVENDAKNFDGKEFNGKNVAEYFGNHGAAIKALADAVKAILEGVED